MIYFVGDIHFGVRRNSKVFHNILMEQISKQFKKFKKNDTVIFMGDIFDSRSSVDFNVLNDCIDVFRELCGRVKEIYIIVGNHDLYYRNNEWGHVNCRFLQFDKLEDRAPVHVINEIRNIKIANKSFLFIPWIDTHEKKECALKEIRKVPDVILGHWDMVGGFAGHEDPLYFKDSDFPEESIVLSGHYHTVRKIGNCQYSGSFISTTFNDIGCRKGMWKLSKGKLEFIPNDAPMFEYVKVDDPKEFVDKFEENKEELERKVSGNFVRVYIQEYSSYSDTIFNNIKSLGPLEISITYNRTFLEEVNYEEEDFEGFDGAGDIKLIITDYIDQNKEKIPEGICPEELKTIINRKNKEFNMVSA